MAKAWKKTDRDGAESGWMLKQPFSYQFMRGPNGHCSACHGSMAVTSAATAVVNIAIHKSAVVKAAMAVVSAVSADATVRMVTKPLGPRQFSC